MAVEAFLGWHGNGKTYCAVEQCLRECVDHGVELWTNAQVLGAHHFDTWDELMSMIERAQSDRLRVKLLVDEAGKFLSSRFWQKMDPRVLTLLQERRKVGRGLDLIYTVPHFRHVDTQLRDITQWAHICRRWGGSEYSHDGGRSPLFFSVRTFRPEQLSTDGTSMLRSKAKPHKRRFVPFSHDLAALYGTGILDMSKPMSAELDARPDYREPAAEVVRPARVDVHVSTAKRAGRRR